MPRCVLSGELGEQGERAIDRHELQLDAAPEPRGGREHAVRRLRRVELEAAERLVADRDAGGEIHDRLHDDREPLAGEDVLDVLLGLAVAPALLDLRGELGTDAVQHVLCRASLEHELAASDALDRREQRRLRNVAVDQATGAGEQRPEALRSAAFGHQGQRRRRRGPLPQHGQQPAAALGREARVEEHDVGRRARDQLDQLALGVTRPDELDVPRPLEDRPDVPERTERAGAEDQAERGRVDLLRTDRGVRTGARRRSAQRAHHGRPSTSRAAIARHAGSRSATPRRST